MNLFACWFLLSSFLPISFLAFPPYCRTSSFWGSDKTSILFWISCFSRARASCYLFNEKFSRSSSLPLLKVCPQREPFLLFYKHVLSILLFAFSYLFSYPKRRPRESNPSPLFRIRPHPPSNPIHFFNIPFPALLILLLPPRLALSQNRLEPSHQTREQEFAENRDFPLQNFVCSDRCLLRGAHCLGH